MKARVKRALAAGVACPWPDTPSLLNRLRSSRQRPRPILRRVILRPEAQSWRSGTSVSHQLWVLSTARCRVHRRPIILDRTTSTHWCITKRLPINSCRERTIWPIARARSTQPQRTYTLVDVGNQNRVWSHVRWRENGVFENCYSKKKWRTTRKC